MLALDWRLFSFANVIEAHKFVGPPNVAQLDADAMPHAVNANVHLAAVKLYYDTVVVKKGRNKHIYSLVNLYLKNLWKIQIEKAVLECRAIRLKVHSMPASLHACMDFDDRNNFHKIQCNFTSNNSKLLYAYGFSVVKTGLFSPHLNTLVYDVLI